MLTVVSANLQRVYFRMSPMHWHRRREAVREFLNAAKPHVLCTQELLKEAIEDVGEMMPGWGWTGMGRSRACQGEYTAIFYDKARLSLQNSGTFWLSKRPDTPGSRSWLSVFPCICTWGDFTDLQEGGTLRFYNTHLDHLSPFARLNGLKIIRRHLEQCDSGVDGVVLTGDFNAKPTSRAMRLFSSGPDYNVIMNAAHPQERTFHAFTKGQQGLPIDYIFTSKNIEIQKAYVERRSFSGRYPSDHYPLVAQIALNSMGTPPPMSR